MRSCWLWLLVLFLIASGCATLKKEKDEISPLLRASEGAPVLAWEVERTIPIYGILLKVRKDPSTNGYPLKFGATVHCGKELFGIVWGVRYHGGLGLDLGDLRVVLIGDDGSILSGNKGVRPEREAIEDADGEIERYLIWFKLGEGDQGIRTIIRPEDRCPHNFKPKIE